MKTNKYAANCKACNARVAANSGILTSDNGRWIVICEACSKPAVVVAEPVVAQEESKREIKLGQIDTLSEKARKWAKDVQRRLVADLFWALDATKERAANDADLLSLIDSMTDRATEFVAMRHNASWWIDCRNDKISAADILRYASGIDYANEPACLLRVVFSARAMQDCRADIAAKKEIEAERVAQEAAKQVQAEIINGGIEEALRFSTKISRNSNITDTRVFTVFNRQTGNAYTYAASARNGKHLVYVASERGKSSAIFCGFLDADLNFSVASNCVLPAHSKRLRALVWLFSHVAQGKQISSNVEILDEDITALCNADGCKFTDWPAAKEIAYDELGEEISYDTLYH